MDRRTVLGVEMLQIRTHKEPDMVIHTCTVLYRPTPFNLLSGLLFGGYANVLEQFQPYRNPFSVISSFVGYRMFTEVANPFAVVSG